VWREDISVWREDISVWREDIDYRLSPTYTDI